MLNSSVIDRVVISKTPAPELQGDFAGGVVKVYTKSFANARQLQVQLSGQYRPVSALPIIILLRAAKIRPAAGFRLRHPEVTGGACRI